MLLITGTIRLPAHRVANALAVMRTMIEASRAEPGCREYSYAQDVLDPGLIRINELWESRDHLDAHFRSDHIAAWRANWTDLQITDRHLQLYETSDPQPT
ncbi:antibiotic biosynthesis monooxygenase [Polymorphobacter glacialis]|uniref:Antibiotic biosynthesis monooxygenase n=1 Tax=Sandarakinorhabdus glacialis TaxID=1614636 RepID=A0A917E2W2_9SPHN|nr:putative quinol monooxygenase [Polymorphobacter glacialis]GGD99759.1 antibiotic biosynthesis monooxygenase [Polymorphobacter glacialis]